jgi:phosphoglycerate dehydrogenase-like enzyme
MSADHPFRTLENVGLAPHVGCVTKENYEVIYGGALDDTAAFLDGKAVRPLNALS